MDQITFWLSPLLLLPGAALLILSTSTRFAQIHNEIHHLGSGDHADHVKESAKLLKRARLFRNALVALYLSAALFSLAGLAGGVTSRWPEFSFQMVVALTFPGIIALISATILLIRESVLSLEIIKMHFGQAE